MDALDRRILREVQQDSSISAAMLAQRCATTASTALRRPQALRSTGVIRGEVAIVDGASVGRGLMMFVSVRLEREDGAAVQAFRQRVTQHPAVMHFHFV